MIRPALYHPRPERWPQWRFSLRALFVAVTLFCVWLGVQVKWIRDRHDARAWLEKNAWVFVGTPPHPAPWSIRLLGEQGVYSVSLPPRPKYSDDELRRLFPEALVKYTPTPSVAAE